MKTCTVANARRNWRMNASLPIAFNSFLTRPDPSAAMAVLDVHLKTGPPGSPKRSLGQLAGWFSFFLGGEIADGGPVFGADVFVDGGADVGGVEGVGAVFAGAGDPVVVAGGDVEEIGFEAAAAEALEGLAGVVDGAAGFGEGDASDA